MDNWARMLYQPCKPLGESNGVVTGSQKHIDLSKEAATEGMVLLKNDGLLPLKKGTKVALFGKGQYDYIKGGGGCAEVHCAYYTDVYKGLKTKEKDISVFDETYAYYKKNIDEQYANGCELGKIKEPELPDALLDRAKEFADVAIVVISRYSGEGMDRVDQKGDYYLSEEEEKMFEKVCEAFDSVIILLNIAGVMDTSWFYKNDKVRSALLMWLPGMEGGLAAADILCGEVNPSGKLTDTFAKDFYDYPSSTTFHESEMFVKYYEDIYVGYRYFETIPEAKEKVIYPFGFGLSYTSFSYENINVCEKDNTITVKLDVVNTGEMAGKEVVQLYSESPQGKLGKPFRELRAFKKTKLLQPSEKENVEMTFSIDNLASYDDLGLCQKAAYILEEGNYYFYIGNGVRDAEKIDYVYTVDEEYRVVKQLATRVKPMYLNKRLRADGTYETLPEEGYYRFEYPKLEKKVIEKPNTSAVLADVADGKVTMDEFLEQLSIEEVISLLEGQRNTGVANTAGMGAPRHSKLQREYGIPCAMTTDGASGLRIYKECGIDATLWPCSTLIACTWNVEIAEKLGVYGALEVLENNLSIWLTPAMNIHRNPLCGRNFEYYSEDPFISGKMAAAMVRGMQSKKVAATVKHFACNNKETNRLNSDSIVSERALREIYLKGFEICVKEADPWVIMTSYNIVNGYRSGENYDLLTGILRGEWGFNGVVSTDWDTLSTHEYETLAGNNIKMPAGFPAHLAAAKIYNGLLCNEVYYRTCAKYVLELLIKMR